MATPETLPSQVPQQLCEAYPALDFSVDPLEIASQAIVKLRERGIQGYIEPAEINLEASAEAEIIIHPVMQIEHSVHAKRRPSPVTNLGEYREARRKQLKLSDTQQLKLIQKAKQGDALALETLWLDAQDLASHIAGFSQSGWPKEDKVQTCLEVVPGAVRRYDSTKGTAFKSYLTRRMLGALQDEERAHGVANGLSRSNYAKLKAALESEDPQTALHELTKSKKTKAGKVKAGFLMAPHLVRGTDIVTSQASLEELIYGGSDDGSDFYNPAAEPLADQDVFKDAALSIDVSELRKVIDGLNERQAFVMTHSHGLFGAPTLTLHEISEILGVTESRVSQIRSSSLEHITRLMAGEESWAQSNRLRKIEVQPSSMSDSRFMQRVHDELSKYRNAKLSDEEIETVIAHMDSWAIQKVDMDEVVYWVLQRSLPVSTKDGEIALDLSNDSPDRRKVGIKDESVSILVENVRGSDLQLAIEIDREIRRLSTGYNPDFEAKFSRRELEIINNLYTTNGELGLKLEIEESTVRTHIHKAMNKLGLASVADLTVVAAREGLIPLEDVPSERTQLLSGRESRLLRDCYNLTYEEGAEALNISVSTYRTHWHNIFKKTGAITQVQAILMAMKDGLIPRFNPDATTQES